MENNFSKIYFISFTFISFILIFSSPAFAESRIKGEVGTGFVFMTEKNRLSVYDKKNISGLKSDSDYNNLVFPVLFFDLFYKYNEKYSFFIKTPLDEASGVLKAGYSSGSYKFKNSIYFHTSIMEKTWKNPYELNNREETDISKKGFGIHQKIDGFFEFKYDYISVDIENDEIGFEHNEMKREGSDHNFEFSHTYKTNKFFLNSALTYSFKDRKGACEKSNTYGASFTPGFVYKNSVISSGVSVKREFFNKKDIVFNKKREFIHLNMGIFYRKNIKNIFFMSGIIYNKKFSDIKFYEAEKKGLFISVGYKF